MHLAYVNQDKGIRPAKRKGARVHVESMVDAFRALGARVTLIEEGDDARTLEALRTAHAASPLALVYERYSLSGGAGARFALDFGVPHVLEVNSPLIDEERAHRGEPKPSSIEIERFAFSNATRLFAVSSQVVDYVRGAGGRPEAIVLTPNAVDAERFQPRSSAVAGVPAGRVVLGFHGRLRPWHAFDRWVRAAAGLVRAGHDIHVLTIGEGDYESPLRAELPEARFTTVGWVSHAEVAEHVAAFDILPLSYSPDAPCYFSPLKLLEGMACGAVPVVPDLGDLPDVVQDGINGLVYDSLSGNGLQGALERVVTDSDLRGRLSGNAIETAREHSWNSIAQLALAVAGKVRTS